MGKQPFEGRAGNDRHAPGVVHRQADIRGAGVAMTNEQAADQL